MADLFQVVTVPLKKIAQLLFSLQIGNTNLGSLIVTGFIFVVLISAIMHGGNIIGRIGELRRKRNSRDSSGRME